MSWHDTVSSTEATVSILLVEDNPDTLGLMRHLTAREKDLECVGAFTGAQEALDHLYTASQEHRPDVIVIDWSMPGLAAPVAIEKIVSTWPNIGVIVFTAHNEPAVHAAAQTAGAWKVVEKDGDFDLLFREVRACAGANG